MNGAQQRAKLIHEASKNGIRCGIPSAPAELTFENENQKVYKVCGSTFLVEPYYDLLCALGYGAYGVVCAAVDLRLVPGCLFYNETFSRWEESGAVLSRRRDSDGRQIIYKHHRHFLDPHRQSTTYVPSLASEPFHRRCLKNNAPSPYVAVKKVRNYLEDLVDGRRVFREIQVLRYLRGHPNIIRLFDVMYPAGISNEYFSDIYMVTDLMDTDLSLVIESTKHIDEEQFRFISYQMFKALVYIHSSGVIHRDIKPSNILLNSDCSVKLCDFGLSRGGVHNAPRRQCRGASPYDKYCFSATPTGEREDGLYSLTNYVVTRYYRAPELLAMSRYNHSIDIWSVGCIMAEILTGCPIFAGSSYLTQLILILSTPGLRGVPTTPEMVDELFVGADEAKCFMKEVLFSRPVEECRELETGTSSVTHDLQLRTALFGSTRIPRGLTFFLAKLLHLDPRQRPTAVEALRDPFFTSVYQPADEVVRMEFPVEGYMTEVPPEELASTPGVINDDADPFMWEYDHRVPREKTLLELYHREMDCYAANNNRIKEFSSVPP